MGSGGRGGCLAVVPDRGGVPARLAAARGAQIAAGLAPATIVHTGPLRGAEVGASRVYAARNGGENLDFIFRLFACLRSMLE